MRINIWGGTIAKTEIRNFRASIEIYRFIQKLENFNENLLRKPIGEGKWSVIEIIGHFYA
ncbi:hypothetical protein CHH57_00800 [Niallia circulans]|uniref:DinB family protein n=1 Tax=Niallia circulans TaxID=1397 RepID=A0AA91TVX3_NIACI|nr:hypothetical protein CHH57_00800 [Niallia circulans]